MLQSWLVSEVMSQSSGTPFRLQSTSHSSGIPLGLAILARPVVISHSSEPVPVAVLARAGSNVTVIRNAVHVAVDLALMRNPVGLAIIARAVVDVALVRNAVAVAVKAAAKVAVVGDPTARTNRGTGPRSRTGRPPA